MKRISHLTIVLILIIYGESCSKLEYSKPLHKNMIDAVFASGVIFYYDDYNVVSNTTGYLKKILKRQGDSVEIGERLYVVANIISASQVIIAELNYKDAVTKVLPHSPTLRQKQQQVAMALKQLNKDSIDYARNLRLFKANTISKLDLENSEIQYQNSLSDYIIQQNALAETIEYLYLNRSTSAKQLDIQKQSDIYNFISAEIDGVIADLYLNEGDLVTPGVTIAKISGGKVKAKLYIDESDINRIKPGQKVLVSLNTAVDSILEAVVTKIYPTFDILNQAFVVEADFVPVPHNVYLFTQTQLQANIIISEKKEALIIPTMCLIQGNSVKVKGDKTLRQVVTGIKNESWVEILSGISEEDLLENPKKDKQ